MTELLCFFLQKASDYSYSYGVKDLHTGDIKHQWEKKEGDVIKGHYSMVEADGRIRIVDYTADSKNGFNAIVKHKGHAVHPHTKATSHSHLKLLPRQEKEVPTYFESDHGVLPLNEGETYQYTTEVPQYVSAETNEVAPIKHTYIYLPKPEEEPKQEITYKFKHYVPEQAPVTELPVDLSLLKQDQKILPVDVSLIKPIEIDLSQEQPQEQQKELSPEELKKFLNDYYSGEYNVAGEQEFRPTPIPNNKNAKRPITTPGLSNYSSGYNYRKPGYDRRNNVRPVQFPPVDNGPPNNQLKRMLRRIANNGYVRYARTITYEDKKK